MCTYSQLEKSVTPLPPGGQWRPLCPKIVRVYRNRYLKMY